MSRSPSPRPIRPPVQPVAAPARQRSGCGCLPLLVLLIVAAAALGYLLFSGWNTPVRSKTAPQYVRVRSGLGVDGIAATLDSLGIIRHRSVFVAAAWASGTARKLQAGFYRVPSKLTEWELLRLLRKGKVSGIPVTIPEGLTARQIGGVLHRTIGIDSAGFVQATRDSAVAHRLGEPLLEGRLMPATYTFTPDEAPESILKQLVAAHRRMFDTEDVRAGAARLNLTPDEVLTLASIVEGEAQAPEERRRIAGVYLNRLRIGMRLQADPTVQYALPRGPRRLFLRDYRIESPYNTYLHSGLPPGPVNNPGRASVDAVLDPEQHEFLYFVADGTGHHIFTKTYEAHQDAVRTVQRRRSP